MCLEKNAFVLAFYIIFVLHVDKIPSKPIKAKWCMYGSGISVKYEKKCKF